MASSRVTGPSKTNASSGSSPVVASHSSHQQFVNVFRHCQVEQWKRSSKVGDVTQLMDKTVKSTVHRIAGAVPAANYIQVPRTSSQSLALTGRYLYVLFRPLPNRFFVIHVDLVVAQEQIAVRVSLGNVFRAFKATHTWLQLPISCAGAHVSPDKITSASNAAPANPTRWTLMCVDCQQLLQTYLNRQFSHVKSIRICANQLVKNFFSSDFDYDHLALKSHSVSRKLRQAGERMPLPREMSFFLKSGDTWNKHYDYVRIPDLIQDTPAVQPQPGKLKSILPEEVLDIMDARGTRPVGVSTTADVRVFAEDGAKPHVTVHRHESKQAKETTGHDEVPARKQPTALKCLEPDPILHLKKVVGFGGGTNQEVCWSKDGVHVYYPCHAVVVVLDISTQQQYHLVGHSDKISCMAINYATTILATGQQGPMPAVRLWDLASQQCKAVFKAHHCGLHSLSMSYNGGMLCGVGRDAHHKQMVVVWNTEQASVDGRTEVIAQTSTDFDIRRMKIAAFDDTRMVSCGRENIRFWRVRNGELRSAPVNLGSHHGVVVNDVEFEGVTGRCLDDPCQQKIFACTSTGLVLQINYRQLKVERVFQVSSPATGPAAAGPNSGILSICVNQAFAATGSADGFLRLWPLDFSHVFLEAEHEASVSALSISADGLKVVCGTTGCQLGIINVESRTYKTLTRANTDSIQSAALSLDGKWLATGSRDGVVCVWDARSLQQLYTFLAPMDMPLKVAFHPRHQCIAVGYRSGFLRLYHTKATSVVAEHRCNSSPVTGVVFVPSGRRLIVSHQDGTLALLDCELQTLKVLRVLGNTTAKLPAETTTSSNSSPVGGDVAWEALSLSGDGRHVAFVGPSVHIVTTVDALTLDEVMHVDISSITAGSRPADALDSAVYVMYAAHCTGHLLVYTTRKRLLRLSASTGQLLSEMSSLHQGSCSALAVFHNAQLLVTAGDRQLRVWDYNMRLDVNYQSFLGHSEDTTKLLIAADNKTLYTCGDSVFLWESQARQPALCASDGLQHGRAMFTGPEHPRKPLSPQPLPASVETLADQLETSTIGEEDTATDGSQPVPIVHCKLNEEPPATNARGQHADEIHGASCSESDSRDSGDGVSSSDEASSECDSDFPVPVQMMERKKKSDQRLRPPSVVKHFVHKPAAHVSPTEKPFLPAGSHEALSLQHVIGFNSSGRGNLLWNPTAGQIAYSVDSVVILEDLSDGSQQFLRGHLTEVSTMCLRHDGKVLVSASGASGLENSRLCLWNTATFQCTKILALHERNIQAVRYSPDDSMLVSLGCYEEPLVVIWETQKYTPLTTANLGISMHDIVWDPFRPGELVSVGDQGQVHFWMIDGSGGGGDDGGDDDDETDSSNVSTALKVHSTLVPAVGQPATAVDGQQTSQMTCAVYATTQVLLVGSSTGVLSAWDTDKNTCFAQWQADHSELTYLFSNGRHLISSSVTGLLKKWSIEGLAELLESSADGSAPSSCQISVDDELAVDGAVVSAVFNADLSLGLVATSSSTVWCVNWTGMSTLRLLSGHSDQVTSVGTWPSSHSCFATSASDGCLRVWMTKERELLLKLYGDEEKACTSLAFGPDHAMPQKQQHSNIAILPTTTSSTAEEQSRDRSSEHKGRSGKNSNGAEQASNLQRDPLVSTREGSGNNDCDPSSIDSMPPCVCGYEDGSLRLFDLQQQHLQLKTSPHTSSVSCARMAADGSVIISGDVSGQLLISNSVTGMTVRRLTQHGSAPISDVDVAPANLAITAIPHRTGNVPSTAAAAAASAPLAGLWLAASVNGRISVWSCDWKRDRCDLIDWLTFPTPTENRLSGRWPHRMYDTSEYCSFPPTLARFSPTDGGLIIYTGFSLHNTLNIYSLNTKQVVKEISLSTWSSCMAVSSETGCCFLGSREGVIRCVSLATGAFQDTVTGCSGITSLSFVTPTDRHHNIAVESSILPSASVPHHRLISASSSGLFLWSVALQSV
ncbi:WD repeat-containing protein 90-like isoform X2 [Sycon ciliatum]|uniref:WD repeat-containing protein 90-like isoform X2 n=1 Tax=Sycon ciliatum TaxID=27933 RepID=UPI0031F6AFD3